MTIRLCHGGIVRRLRRNSTSTVDAHAEEAGQCRRTVLRDIGAMRNDGCVCHSDGDRGGAPA
ncbi:hypothetical protein IQ782_29145 [Salipiger pacificus]|uniref:DeoR-like helix-turn-helix domain-containing protein n=1 Tax=Salipiger mangrovisoli TaxID=2865933 RepID=A0ABR9XBB1_9RHOB|nr:hypothetical protein [Salipiger mangrovisoli]